MKDPLKPLPGPVHEEMLYLQVLEMMGVAPDRVNWKEVLEDFDTFLKEKN